MSTVLPRPEIIHTHESDLDGFVAGLLLQRLAQTIFGSPVRLEASHYNVWRQRTLAEKSGWVTDFTFETRMDKPNWVVIDHHVTESKPRHARLIHDLGKSAGLLCYELCREHGLATPELDRLVHLNNVADLFLEDAPEFAEANDYANLVKVYGFWNLHEIIAGRLENLLDHPLLEVMAVKRRVEDPLGFQWSRDHVTPLSQKVGLVNTVVGNVNLIVHRLLEEAATPYPVLVTLFRRSNGLVIASFSSRTGEALSVAQKFQGGGHANAAGALLPRSVQTIADGVDYLKRMLDPQSPRPNQGGGLTSLESLLDGVKVD